MSRTRFRGIPHSIVGWMSRNSLLLGWVLVFELSGCGFESSCSIGFICFLGFDVINFDINLILLIKLFLYVTKKSRQKFKYLENKKSFYVEIRNISHHCYRAFSCQKLSQTWNAPLSKLKYIKIHKYIWNKMKQWKLLVFLEYIRL